MECFHLEAANLASKSQLLLFHGKVCSLLFCQTFFLTGLIMLLNVGYHGSLEPQEQIFAIEIRKIHSTYNKGRQNFN